MTSAEVVLGGIAISILSGTIGKVIGSSGKVGENQCNERRQACNSLVLREVKSIKEMLENHINETRSFKN